MYTLFQYIPEAVVRQDLLQILYNSMQTKCSYIVQIKRLDTAERLRYGRYSGN